MTILRPMVIYLSRFSASQKYLEYFANISQNLMGIGCGSSGGMSGEGAIFKVLKKSAAPPYTIFDVGSNKGQFLDIILSQIPAGDYRIHCFEPSTYPFGLLCEKAKGIPNISLNQIGLGKEKGEVPLYYHTPGAGTASLTKRRLDHFGKRTMVSETVSIDTLDNYCHANMISHIDLLKMDVEGHELDVLHGASEIMNRNRIRMISFEFGGCNIDTRTFMQDYFYFFPSYMKIFRLTPSGYLFTLPKYREQDEQFRTSNFLVINEAFQSKAREGGDGDSVS